MNDQNDSPSQDFLKECIDAITNRDFKELVYTEKEDPQRVSQAFEHAAETLIPEDLPDRATVDEIMSKMADAVSSGGTAEFPSWYLPVSIASAIASMDQKASEKARQIPVAMSYSGLLNAVTLKSPSGRPVVMFDLGATYLVEYLVIAVLGSIPRGSSPERPRPCTHNAIAVVHNAIKFLLTRDVRFFAFAALHAGEVVRELEQEGEIISARLMAGGAEQFVVLHEFGHAILGHLDRARLLQLNMRGVDVNAMMGHHEIEHEADIFASEQSREDPNFWLGCAMLFPILAQAEKLEGAPLAQTHPTWNVRWRKLEPYVPSSLAHLVHFLSGHAYRLCSVQEGMAEQIPEVLEATPEEVARQLFD
ncbi:hypothetical protein [Actinoplanes sp. NPDC048796]|uniref:hypothetical protein n=1 Tax=Actinoplanes sp. NPDC048796 TaxID=3155640 RepID=UPI0033EB274F